MGILLKQYILFGSYDKFETLYLYFLKICNQETWHSDYLGSGATQVDVPLIV